MLSLATHAIGVARPKAVYTNATNRSGSEEIKISVLNREKLIK